jgi:glyceraldehyde 3-phosphate dehydrogenase
MNIALNGFGRIGRNFVRAVFADQAAQKKITIKAINIGSANPEFIAHMFKYDTLMGPFHGTVSKKGKELIINGHKIALIAELDAKKINWKAHKIEWVVDATGHYTNAEKARDHITAGAKKVLITAPAHGEDVSIILGVNLKAYDAKKHQIVSLGSCTTNAFIPMLKVLQDAFGIEQGFMTTTHAYTNSQVLLDVEAKDLRISRAAALNIIPTSTGASEMLGKVMPALGKKIISSSLRVPVGKVSLIDLVVTISKKASREQINKAFEAAAKGSLKNIVYVTHEPLVSSDFSGSNASVTIDTELTQSLGTFVKVNGWYDNEWGYSERLKDFLMTIS